MTSNVKFTENNNGIYGGIVSDIVVVDFARTLFGRLPFQRVSEEICWLQNSS